MTSGETAADAAGNNAYIWNRARKGLRWLADWRVVWVVSAMAWAFSDVQAEQPSYEVAKPPEELQLDNFYQKHVTASGYSIVSSAKVSDYALKEAAYLVDTMLKERKDILAAMTKNGSRLIVMAHNEYTTDIPEYSHMRPKNYWDVRARGLGGAGKRDPVCSCGEENLLSYPGDPYSAESIFIHEFAHNIHLLGMSTVDPTFDRRLRAAYDRAMAQGLWKTKYASTNHAEYFAEGVQSWFNNNRPPDHDHNHVDTRKELIEYDSGLADLCREVFGETKFEYTKAPTRLAAHLEGYDPKDAPRFVWPKRLLAEQRKIREAARQRGKEKPAKKQKKEAVNKDAAKKEAANKEAAKKEEAASKSSSVQQNAE